MMRNVDWNDGVMERETVTTWQPMEATAPSRALVVEAATQAAASRDMPHVAALGEIGNVSQLDWVVLSEVTETSISWLWEGRIPLGALTVLDGDPGLGKSLVTLDIAARVTTGRPMPDGTPGVRGGVMLLSCEDSLATTTVPRLAAAGADLGRILALQTVWRFDGQTMRERSVSLPLDVPLIADEMARADARLLIVDPLMAYLDARTNSFRDQDMRAALAPLARLAQQRQAAVLIVRHLNKSEQGNPLYRGGGSIGIIGAARSGLLVGKSPHDPEHERVLAGIKSNLAAPRPALRYRLVKAPAAESGTPSRVMVDWRGECTLSASDLLRSADGDADERLALAEAQEWLRSMLASGPAPARDLLAKCKEIGVSERTLRRAKVALDVVSQRDAFGAQGSWSWALPPAPDNQEHS